MEVTSKQEEEVDSECTGGGVECTEYVEKQKTSSAPESYVKHRWNTERARFYIQL
jgi:hypothetical protein